MRVEIKVQPKSSKKEILKTGPDTYKVYMFEPAVEGKANKRLIEMLADYFETKKNRIKILSGSKSRDKIIEIS